MKSWSPAQDHSHQNSLVSNPIKSYQTFSLQTYECLKLETRGFVSICLTGNLWVYASSELLMGKKEHSVRMGSEPFFQLLARSLGSKLSITHVGKPLSLQRWIHAVLAKIRWLFYFLLSSSSLLNPLEESAGTFQWGYWIFYWQASTKEPVPIVTIWKSLPLRAHTRGEPVPSYTIPAVNNARKPTTSSEAYKSPCWSPTVSLVLKKEQIHMLEMSIPNSLSSL